MTTVTSMPSMTVGQAIEAFPSIPQVIILKTDITRQGVDFTPAARNELAKRDDLQTKGLDIFSQAMGKPETLKDKIPTQGVLEDGTPRGSMFVIRTGGETPYAIDFADGEYWLTSHGKRITQVIRFTPKVPWFNVKLPDGTPVYTIVQGVGEPGCLAYVTLNKHCEYFNLKKQCQYCDLVPNASVQKAAGDPMVTRKSTDQVCDALEIAFALGARRTFLTGGTFLGHYQGKTDLEWYGDQLDSIRKRLIQWPNTTFQMGPMEEDAMRRIHATGVPDVQMNIEVWNKRLFEMICPGKAEHVGYDEWKRRMLKAVDIWGPHRVTTSFVTGVEMCQPYGFTDVDEAVASIAEGYEWMMSNGINCRYGEMWCVAEGSQLAGNMNPPLEFYLKAGVRYNEIREKYVPHPEPHLYGYQRGYNLSLDGEMYFWCGTGLGSYKSLKEAGMKFGPMPDYTKVL